MSVTWTAKASMPKPTADSRRICVKYHNNYYSKGYFMGDNPFDHAFPIFLFQLITAFCISKVIYFLLKPLKQPEFVSNVLSGIILGPSFLGRDIALADKLFPLKDAAVLNTVASIGGLYFIFLVSVKMDTAGVLRMAKNDWIIGMTCFTVTFIITYSLVYMLSRHVTGLAEGGFTFFLSAILSLTYFPDVAHAITELNLLTSELGQLSMSTALFSEIISWFCIALSPAFRGEMTHIINTEFSILAMTSFAFFILRPALLRIVETTPEGKPVKEIYIVAILAGTLMMGILSDIMGSSYMPGAVLMGLIIPAGPPLGSALIDRCELVISNFFMPMFFIRIGQLTDVYSLTSGTEIAAFELIIMGSNIGKLVASLLCMRLIKIRVKKALLFSCILNLKGIIDLIVILRWRVLKFLDEQCFTTLVLSHLVITAILTPVISICYKPQIKLKVTVSVENRMKTLATTPFDCELRILCCFHIEKSVHGIITLLKGFNPTEISPICVYAVNLVELVGRAAPLLVPYNMQTTKLRANSTDRIMRALTKFSKNYDVPVTIQPFTLIAPYKSMHESISKLARDKFIPLILIPFHQIQNQDAEASTASLRKFNINMQAYSPCTIGIFVDRGLPRYLTSSYFSYNVAVFFLGGPDDREAMALASRMSANFDIHLTLFKIDLIENDQEQDESEKFLDDNVINEFKSKNIGNASFVFHQIEATNTLEVMDAIRSWENYYDLVMVGKRRRAKSTLEKEMEPWADYQELGVIGDVLASADFCGGMIPVLVIQCIGRQVNKNNMCDIKSVTEEGSQSSLGSSLRDNEFLGSWKTDKRGSRKQSFN